MTENIISFKPRKKETTKQNSQLDLIEDSVLIDMINKILTDALEDIMNPNNFTTILFNGPRYFDGNGDPKIEQYLQKYWEHRIGTLMVWFSKVYAKTPMPADDKYLFSMVYKCLNSDLQDRVNLPIMVNGVVNTLILHRKCNNFWVLTDAYENHMHFTSKAFSSMAEDLKLNIKEMFLGIPNGL